MTNVFMINPDAVMLDIAKAKYQQLNGAGVGTEEHWQEALTYAQENSSQAITDANNVLLAALQSEIINDSAGRGYAGKTDQEIADLINKPWIETIEHTENMPLSAIVSDMLFGYTITTDYSIDDQGNVTCADADVKSLLEAIVNQAKTKSVQILTQTIDHGNRIFAIFGGLPYSANAVTADDVAAAKNYNGNA